MFFRITLFFLFLLSNLNAQVLCGKIFGLNKDRNKLYLRDQVGLNFSLIDSLVISKEGSFSFPAKKYPCGYYQIQLNSDTNRADLILNPIEDTVKLVLVKDKLIDGFNVVKSQENKVLWEYKRNSRTLFKKEIDLKKLMSQTPVGDTKMQSSLRAELDKIQNQKLSTLVALVKENPDLYFSRVAKSSVALIVYLNKEEQKKHYFDHVNFKDADLIRSSVFTNAMFEYLTKYTEYTEAGFKQSLDTIMIKASASMAVSDFCLDYLLTLFNKTGPEIIFDYLVEKYLLKDGCSEANVSNMFKQTANEYKNVMVGNVIDNFALTDLKSTQVNLKNVAAKGAITVLFFWSSHCTFCHEAIEQFKLKEKQIKERNITLALISIDKERVELDKFLKENKLPWLVYNETEGWESKIVKQLKIHRTPGFLEIDKDLIIKSKPQSYKELLNEFVK